MLKAEAIDALRVEGEHAPRSEVPWQTIGRFALCASVGGYLAIVLLGPILALAFGAVELGLLELVYALRSEEALAAFGNTLLLLLIAVPVNAVVGVMGALVVTRHRFVGRSFASALFDLPLAVSPIMVGLAFLLLLGQEGLLSPVLAELGWQVVFSFPGLVIATLFVSLPFTVREVAYVLAELGTSEEEAATTLGATPWQSFWHVTLPNVRTALGYGTLMTTARTLGEFGAVLVLGGSISGQTQTATTFIHDAMEERHLPAAYGMAVLLAVISVSLLLLLEALRRRADHPKNKPKARR